MPVYWSHWWLCNELQGSFYLRGLTLIPAWIRNHVPSKVWDEIINPFPNSMVNCWSLRMFKRAPRVIFSIMLSDNHVCCWFHTKCFALPDRMIIYLCFWTEGMWINFRQSMMTEIQSMTVMAVRKRLLVCRWLGDFHYQGGGYTVTKALFSNFSVREILSFAEVLVRFFKSHSYLTGVTAA